MTGGSYNKESVFIAMTILYPMHITLNAIPCSALGHNIFRPKTEDVKNAKIIHVHLMTKGNVWAPLVGLTKSFVKMENASDANLIQWGIQNKTNVKSLFAKVMNL